ncbi:MAG: carbohydrate porin, partial [Prevotellaceae bacterium]|nr:carbohydrate porin [Prevotellaceae bacterium]
FDLHKTVHKHETTLELYYKWQFNDNFAIQPDIQYSINPSGTDEKLSNALLGILRLYINF